MEEYEVAIKPDVVFAEHDGVELLGDLYRPKGLHKAPVLVAAHGGGWQLGDRKFYRHWGNYLARNGYPVEEPGSFGAYVGPKLLRFLAGQL